MYIDKNNFREISQTAIENLFIENDIYCNKELIDLLQSLKKYLTSNPTNEDVIAYRKQLATLFQTHFLQDKIYQKFNLSDYYKYQKIQEIYKVLPFNLEHTVYPDYLYHILTMFAIHFANFCLFFCRQKSTCKK